MPLVERRYAEALVDIAVQHGKIDDFQQELGSVVDIINRHPDLDDFLLNPEIRVEAKKGALKNIFGGSIQSELDNFLMLLLDKGRIKYLPGIYDEFARLADRKKNVINMIIVSAAPLQEPQVDQIKEKFRKEYNAYSVKAAVEVDQSLIGGVKVIIGDKVIDGSIKGRLAGLKEELIG